MWRRSLLGLLAMCCLATVLWGQPQEMPPVFYAFLRSDVAPRGAALGGAAVALTQQGEDVFYNPAVLPTLEGAAVAFVFEKHLLDMNAGFATVAFPATMVAPSLSGMGGIGVQYVDYGEFERNDAAGNRLGTFRAAHFAFQLHYANALDTLFYYGVAAKVIVSRLEQYAATAVALDVGLLYQMPDRRTTVGLAIRHLGAQLSTTAAGQERLPLDVRLGIAHKPRGLPLLLNVALVQLADPYHRFSDLLDRIAIGGEWRFGKVVRVRIGYNQFRRQNMRLPQQSGWSGFAGGVGLQFDRYTVNYAIVAFGTQSFIHRIGIGIRW